MARRHAQRPARRASSAPRQPRPSALLLALVARAAHGWWAWWRARLATWHAWRARRQAAAKASLARADGFQAFETLEPRLLLSADLNLAAAGTLPVVDPLAGTSIQRTVDGPHMHATAVPSQATASVQVLGPGQATLTADASGAYSLQLTGTTALSLVTLNVSDNTHIQLSQISVSGAVGGLDLSLGDLHGSALFQGNVGSLQLGQVQGANIQAQGAGAFSFKADNVVSSTLQTASTLASIDVQSWTGAGSQLSAAGIKALNTLGDFSADLAVSGSGVTDYALNTVTIGGQVTGGVWAVHGRSKAVSLGSAGPDWQANFTGALSLLASRGNLGGQINLPAVQTVQVGGSAQSLRMAVGANLGDDAKLGGTGANADSFKAGTLARLRVTGNLQDSTILVGVDPVNGIWGDGNDAQLGTTQVVQELVIGGKVINSQVAAPGFPATVRVNGQAVASSTLGAWLGQQLPDAVAPQLAVALLQDSGTSASDGVTNQALLKLTASDAGGIASFRVQLDGGAAVNTAGSKQADGTWQLNLASLAPGGVLADGAHAVVVQAIDAAGNASTAQTLNLTLKTALPSIALSLDPASDTGLAGDLKTTLPSVNLIGQTQAGVVVNWLGQAVTADATGRVTLTNVPLVLGSNTIDVTLSDVAGNTAAGGITLQRVVPPSVANLRLASDSGASNTDGVTNAVTMLADVSPAANQVLLALDGGSTPTFTAVAGTLDGAGHLQISAAQLATLAGGSLAQGSHTLQVKVMDSAGLTSTVASLNFTLDSVAPPVGLSLVAASDTGTPGDLKTSLAAVDILVSTQAGAKVQWNGQTFTADTAGVVTLSNVALAVGANAISVEASDAAGNATSSSLTVQRVVAPTLANLRLETDSGASGTDLITHTANVVADVNATATQVWVALDPARPSPVFTALTGALDGAGHLKILAAQLATLAGGSLSQGAHTLWVKVLDNTGLSSAPLSLTFTLDSVAPSFSMSLAPASDTGTAGDLSTEAATVTVLVQTQAGVVLTWHGQTFTADANGQASLTNIPLTLGSNAIDVTAQDAAGNTASGTLTVQRTAPTVVDTVAPTLANVRLETDSGASITDRVTQTVTVLADASDNVGVVKLQVALDPSGTPTFSDLNAALGANGQIKVTRAQLDALAGGTLAQGAHTLVMRVQDAAGLNSSAVSLSFTLDSVAPTGASFGVAAADAVDGQNNQAAAALVTLTGTAEVGATVSLGNTKALVGAAGTFSLPGVSLAMGDNTVAITVTDAAGNTQVVSRTLTRVAPTQTDTVLAWTQLALNAIQADVTDPPIATRMLAIESLAVYDTLAAIQGTPAYMVQRTVSGSVSADAAVAQA
ncbi:MAG: hypothetical protein RI907_977, partial [Pseudomonadota bacterium]